MANIAYYQEGYTDGYQDGKEMAKKNAIEHTGRIVEITPDFTTVEIMVSSACSECHAKGLCGMSEEQDKVIMVPTDPYTVRAVGDEVQVKTKMSMGMKAVRLAFLFPLVLLVAAVAMVMWLADGNEALAALAALLVLTIYFLLLFANKKKLAREFTFTIKPI